MKQSTLLILLAVGAGVLLMSMASGPSVDLSFLQGQYDSDDIARLQRAANALAAQGVTGDTLNYLLSQVLVETGIFTTSNQNYVATDTRNNFSGITNSDGTFRFYSSAGDWAADYLAVLGHGPYYPIQATSITDFNNRLKQNGYYTDNQTTYGNNLNYYYNILTQNS